ncbi:MAG TPA: adenylate/guanylate cyclase domain-containing protein [Anaerolineales bacterium]|nr:adenylate/guanylate cyclase domain-containing protein [Anaerolineales bacterium]
MPQRVIIVQSEKTSAQVLGGYFRKRGDKVWQTTDATQAFELVNGQRPDLVFLDIHMAGNVWLEILSHIRRHLAKTNVIITSRHPDVRREMLAKEQGGTVFLREPFTPEWIQKSLEKLERGEKARELKPSPGELPPVRVPIRVKLTAPFALLALLFAITAVYLGSRFLLEGFQERFTNQLIDTRTLSADWIVQEENRMLETLRLLSNTEGVPEAIRAGDAGRLREIALPIAINYREEAIEILDTQGFSVLSLRSQPGGDAENFTALKGEATQAQWDFVQRVLRQEVDQQGDKYAGLVRAPWGAYFYIAGPIFQENQLAGVILVGKSTTALARQMRQDTLAQITFYDLDGELLASTLLSSGEVPPLPRELLSGVLEKQDQKSLMRSLPLATTGYSEILGPWEARNGEDIGVMGVALTENFLLKPSTFTRAQAFLIVALTFLCVIILGAYLANQVTTPLSQVVHASTQVAHGNLEVKVPPKGNDEVAVLAHAFNYMVSGLQEGSIYRDLLGRTVSPEVREALRHSFASGDLRLEGQTSTSTVLMSDIRRFTTLSEKEAPTTILNWLNEYFGELVPIIAAHGGVVDKFEGDAMLAFFGILPTPQPPEDSAYQACRAAVEMTGVIEQINARRAKRHEPALITGISLNTGPVTAGGLGTADRLNYTVIGDTVNTVQRMQAISRQFGETGVVISESTLTYLKDRRAEFRLAPLGEHAFKGKLSQLWLYRLWLEDNGRNKERIQDEAAGAAVKVTDG